MSKYLYEFSEKQKNQYTIVYENKSYIYCKVNGSDVLKQIPKNWVDSGNMYNGYFITTSIIELTKRDVEVQKYKTAITRYKRTIKQKEDELSYNLSAISQIKKEIKILEGELENAEEELKVLETK